MALVCRPRAYAGTSSVLQPRGRRYAKVRLKLLLQMSLQRLVHAGLVAKRPRANCSSLMVVGFAVLAHWAAISRSSSTVSSDQIREVE